VLSGGPVGIGDGLGFTNASLASMAANSAGLILRPSKPLTAIDSLFVPPPASSRRSAAGTDTGIERERALVGFLPLMEGTTGCASLQTPGSPYPAWCQPGAEQTHTLVPLEPSYASRLGLTAGVGAAWRIVVSIHLGSFLLPRADLLPIDNQQLFEPRSYRELRWQRCTNGTKNTVRASGDGCLARLDPQQPSHLLFDIRSGDRAPSVSETGAEVVPWRMFTLYPALPESSADDQRAWTLLGEVNKIVGVSGARFTSVGVDTLSGGQSCVTFELVVALDERVTIGAVTPAGEYREEVFEASGSQRMCNS
jgi:hypothetical protein